MKALEYYLKDQLEARGLGQIKEWVHFACTSEDINNTAYALMLREGRKIIVHHIQEILEKIEKLAEEYKSSPMMSHTHGQPATPTTFGKELVVFAWRIRRELDALKGLKFEAKMNGATGAFNAHVTVFPDADWITLSQNFITNRLKLKPLIWTTQINPYHGIAELMHILVRVCATLIDFDRDMWGYISMGYLMQRLEEDEVGSSTMPHKINPIDFENSEGNLGLSIAIMEHIAVKLLGSRFQRDLSDSTVLRNLGSVFGYLLIGLKSSRKGLSKIGVNKEIMVKDLQANVELLAEPIQTAMRACGEENPYERLKILTRGKQVTKKDLDLLVEDLDKMPPCVKERLKEMKPEKYIGLAAQLVDAYFKMYAKKCQT